MIANLIYYELSYKIIDVLTSISETYLLFVFLKLFLNQRSSTKKKQYFIFSIIAFTHIFFIEIQQISTINLVTFIAFDLVFCWALFSGKKYKYLIFIGLFYIIIAVCESVIFAVCNIAIQGFDATNAVKDHSRQTVLLTIILRLLEFTVIQIIKFFKNRPIKRNHWQGLLIMPIVTITFAWIVFPRNWAFKNEQINRLLMAFAIFLVIQNLIVFAYIAAMQNATERYLKMKEIYDQQRNRYAALRTVQQAVRKMSHDIKHHFGYILSALNRGNIDDAKQYIIEYDQRLEGMFPINFTGNDDVDALLQAKFQQAASEGIPIRVDGSWPRYTTISPVDLSMLLGNALENAIEATSHITGEKEIVAQFVCNEPRLSFTISNPYSGTLRVKPSGYIASQKNNGGLGMKIIRDVANLYNGIVQTEFSEKNFTVSVVLQMQRQLEDKAV